MTDPVRLAKRVAALRACSRREAELLITGGWVRVDGVVVETPQVRVGGESIAIDPTADPSAAQIVTLLWHKPPGGHALPAAGEFGATQWAEDGSGIRPLKKHLAGLVACAPLDDATSGLVVYSQDWRIVRRLVDDAATLEHEIVVEVADAVGRAPGALGRDDRRAAAPKASWQNETHLRIAIKGAQAGEVARACAAAGLPPLAMKRIRLGRVPLGKLPQGFWRYLRADERF